MRRSWHAEDFDDTESQDNLSDAVNLAFPNKSAYLGVGLNALALRHFSQLSRSMPLVAPESTRWLIKILPPCEQCGSLQAKKCNRKQSRGWRASSRMQAGAHLAVLEHMAVLLLGVQVVMRCLRPSCANMKCFVAHLYSCRLCKAMVATISQATHMHCCRHSQALQGQTEATQLPCRNFRQYTGWMGPNGTPIRVARVTGMFL